MINSTIIYARGYMVMTCTLLVTCDIAIEHGHRNCVIFPMRNGGCFHSFVELPEGNH